MKNVSGEIVEDTKEYLNGDIGTAFRNKFNNMIFSRINNLNIVITLSTENKDKTFVEFKFMILISSIFGQLISKQLL